MEVQAHFSWFQSYFSFIFFTITSCFIIISLMLLLLRSRTWCNCHMCRAYLRATWATDFENLVDWHAHLLHSSPTGTITIHVTNNTITANPANVEYMLKTRFDNFPKGEPFSAILGDFLGRGIFNVDGDLWAFQRKLACLELGSFNVRSHAFATVSTEIHLRLLPLLSAVTDGNILDLQDVFHRFAFNTICNISFGLDPRCLDLSLSIPEFAIAFDAASNLSAQRATVVSPIVWKLKRLLNLGSERELRRAIGLVKTLADELIQERRRVGFSSRNDLLSRLMLMVDDHEYLRDIVISFLLAGRDTVASALTSFFLLLSRHPSVEAAILDEISAKNCEDDDVASYEELREMQYVHAAIYESMRLYPPVQFGSKFCLGDDVLPDGTFVRKGTRVTYHPYAMGRMEGLWGDDGREFRPERWMRDGVFVPESPFKYPVFQGGLRVCLGKELALMEVKAVVVSVVREFKVYLIDGSGPTKFAAGLTASFSGGLRVGVQRRQR